MQKKREGGQQERGGGRGERRASPRGGDRDWQEKHGACRFHAAGRVIRPWASGTRCNLTVRDTLTYLPNAPAGTR